MKRKIIFLINLLKSTNSGLDLALILNQLNLKMHLHSEILKDSKINLQHQDQTNFTMSQYKIKILTKLHVFVHKSKDLMKIGL